MRRVIITAMIAVVWMGYRDKNRPVVEPQIIEVAETSDDKLYNTAALFIKSEESLKLKPYKCQGGKWTIGWGHVMTKAEHRKYRNGISVKQADELFDKDYSKFIKDVKRRFPELKSRKKVILTSMIAFNIGMRFTTDGLGKAIKRGRDIEPYLLQYKIAGGRVSRGLARRRKAELELWNSSRNEIIAAADDYRDTVRRKIKEAYQSI
jgi:lysozyme